MTRQWKEWKLFYLTVRRQTGSKEEARKALIYVMRIDAEIQREKAAV